MSRFYFSPLRRALERLTQNAAAPDQWLGTLRNMQGVRNAEIVDSGMEDLLTQQMAGRNSPVLREELLSHLDDEGVTIDEVLLGGPPHSRASHHSDGSPAYEYENRSDAERQLLEDYEADFEHARERHEEGAREGWYDRFDAFDPDNWDVRPYPPGLETPPRINWPDETTGDLFGVEPVRQAHYAEDVYIPGPHVGNNVYDREVVVRAGDPVRYWLGERSMRSRTGNPEHDDAFGAQNLPAWAPHTLRDYSEPITNADGSFGSYRGYDTLEPFESEAVARRVLSMLDDNRYEYMDDYDAFYDSQEAHRAYQDARQEIIERYIDQYAYPENAGASRGVKWQGYALPGGKDYGELVIRHGDVGDDGERGYPSHFEDVDEVGDNALAHVRFDTRNDAEGNPVLLIQEVQSDLHQRGRAGGYRKRASPQEIQAREKALMEINVDRDRLYNEFVDLVKRSVPEDTLARANASIRGGIPSAYDYVTAAMRLLGLHNQGQYLRLPEGSLRNTLSAAWDDYNRINLASIRAESELQHARLGKGAVPDAPLKNNIWAELVMKRMIRWAADHGFKKLAWVPGRVKNGTIHDGDVAGGAFYDAVLPNIANRLVKKHGGRVRQEPIPGIVAPRGAQHFQAHVIDITPSLAKQYQDEGVSIYAGLDPAKAKNLREALVAALGAGGYMALVSAIAEMERRRQDRANAA